MQLTIYNCSSKGIQGNTYAFLDSFMGGFMKNDENKCELVNLINEETFTGAASKFIKSENVLIAFPLYYDSMPALAKGFIETLGELSKGCPRPSLIFFIQSGAPETLQMAPVVRYVEKLAGRLGCRHSGTIVKGSGDAVKIAPPKVKDKILKEFFDLGRSFGETGVLEKVKLDKMALPHRLSRTILFLYTLTQKLGINPVDKYWNDWLKKNNAYNRRFDAPYKPVCAFRSK